MRQLRWLAALILTISGPFMSAAQADLGADLRDGRHVLLMRHADAPGYGDPMGYSLSDCATQRNLGELGRQQAQRAGEWLARMGVREGLVYSSPWCRCLDTARLLNKGPVQTADALGSFFDDMSQERRQTRALVDLIRSSLAQTPRRPVLLITHHVNIQAFTGVAVGSGDIVIARVDDQGRYQSHRLFPASVTSR